MKIAIFILSLINVYFFVRGIRIYKQIKELKLKIQQQADLASLSTDAVQESFLKFVSDSREWAYTYIEEVQAALTKFKNNVDPLITYFDTYGDTLSTQRPDYEAMKKISYAYKELISVLPEDENDKTKE